VPVHASTPSTHPLPPAAISKEPLCHPALPTLAASGNSITCPHRRALEEEEEKEGEEKEESDRGSDVGAAAGAGGRPGDPGLGLDEKLEAP
jgi:hypothetical protein